jgi:hypothetical protein
LIADGVMPAANCTDLIDSAGQAISDLGHFRMIFPERAIPRCDVGCVQAAITCSAELPVKYECGLRVLSPCLLKA